MSRRAIHVPRALAWVMGLAGLLNVVAGFWHKDWEVLKWMENWVPFGISESSRQLLVGVGFMQLLLSRGIARGKHAAWQIATVTLVLTPCLHLGRAFDWHHALGSLCFLAALLAARRYFVARSDAPSLRWAIWIGVGVFLVLAASAVTALNRYAPEISGRQDWPGHVQTALELIFLQGTDTQAPLTPRAETLFLVIQASAWGAWVLGMVLALRPVLLRKESTEEERAAMRLLVDRHGKDPLVEFALLPDKRYFFHGAEGAACGVAYAVWRNYAVTLADPVGPAEAVEAAARAFYLFCRRQDWEPVFYEVAADHVEIYRRLGLATFKIAEDARLPLEEFTLQGGKFQNLRTALNKARKTGHEFRWYAGTPVDHGLEAQLKVVSDAWIAHKHGMEMTFDLGSFSLPEIRQRGAAVVLSAEGQVQAFATWLPYRGGKGRCLDLMRSLPGAPGLMDYLILESSTHFREAGVEEISLGNAPLANVESEEAVLQAEEKAVKYLFENFNHIYGYKSLFEFKKKYHPQWRGRYVAYMGPADLPAVILAMVHVHVPRGLWKMLRS